MACSSAALLVVIQVTLRVSLVGSAPEADLVENLLGWNGTLFSKTYSGYIPVGSEDGYTMYEHYMFFESEGNPQKDPLIMWTNGGPGAPSMFGAFTELGPYFLCGESMRTAAYNSTGVPTLFANAHRWTKLGSVLIRNLPPPVGFSYCNPAGPDGENSCGSWNDTKVARHSVAFMRAWMDEFPEYASRDLYLTGESYAGVYVPMLAKEILQGGGMLAAQLRGIVVGDGCLGGDGAGSSCTPYRGPFFEVAFFHGHGQFSDKTYNEIMHTCTREELMSGQTSPACKAVLDRMDKEKGYSFDYNLYDECYDFSLRTRRWDQDRKYWGPPSPPRGGARRVDGVVGDPGEWHMDGTPCGGLSVLPKWLATPGVRSALHVPDSARYFQSDNGVGFTYNFTEPSLATWYASEAARRIRILVYNGDADPGLNSFYAQTWISSLGIPEAESWRPWTRDGQVKMGGYVTRYAGGFDFVTIRGAGHMVPEYKPEAAYVMMSAFLRGAEYPRYQPNATVTENPT
eukprot:CAMPEP_0170205492 /NCGR_PEP_ID=MMETSP0116_2-20130129/2290_1 /TAXON_ID=400756 /ORGANISM="Durinskia baltica, Strain CSIRO CS-38" /LENGTH=512 /DNA_ID=CAMNT_0010455883 /DNA_START=43 /DNA_END=1577 /DNA_ORIENTATION=+